MKDYKVLLSLYREEGFNGGIDLNEYLNYYSENYLKELKIIDIINSSFSKFDFEELSKTCPNLEHLIIYEDESEQEGLVFAKKILQIEKSKNFNSEKVILHLDLEETVETFQVSKYLNIKNIKEKNIKFIEVDTNECFKIFNEEQKVDLKRKIIKKLGNKFIINLI